MSTTARRPFLERLQLTFLRRLVATPQGRAFLLAQVADTESSGEGSVFERLVEATPDLQLQRLMRRHVADEARHAQLLEAHLATLDVPRPQLPESHNLLFALGTRLGIFDRPPETGADIARAYTFLLVLEERVVWQFPLIIEALAPVDPAAARVFEEILADERNHVRYCQAIIARFAESPEAQAAQLAHFRKEEAEAFAFNGSLSLRHAVAHGLLGDSPGLWRAAAVVSGLTTRPPAGYVDPRFFPGAPGEPHRARRQALLARHPEIRKLFGFDRRTIAVTAVVAVAQLALAASLAQASWWLIVPAAYFVGAVLSHWLGQSIHETAHRLAARTRWANRAVAWLANAPMVLPMAETFHRYHLEHHTLLGVAGRDHDLPLPGELDWIGRGRLAKFLWLAFYPVVYVLRGARYSRGVTHAEWVNVVAMLAINAGLWALWGPKALAFLALSTFFGHGLHPVAAHFIHEHYVVEGRQETYSYDGPLNWVTFHVGYHVEHHDFMNIPGWRLPAYRALVGRGEEGLVHHGSWTRVLVDFILRQDLGPASRVVRVR